MRGKLFAGVLVAAALLGAGTAFAATFAAGSDGLGDPFFPHGGNGGYDVQRYGLTLDYDPPANHPAGTAAITAKATQALSRFDLDFRGTPRFPSDQRPRERRPGRGLAAGTGAR